MSRPVAFVGMESSGALRRRLQAMGIMTFSADFLPPTTEGAEEMAFADDGTELGHHMVGDVFEALEWLEVLGLYPTLGVFHPTCTYLTCSAEWAYGDGPYHQKVKPGTLVGAERREAREEALEDVRRIMALPIPLKAIENPRGVIGTRIRKADQIIQPYEFGDDASKATCLWLEGLPPLPIIPERRCPGRWVKRPDGRPVERWSNQTDAGQNRLSPGADRWKVRSETFPGVADAMAKTWGGYLLQVTPR